MNVVRGDRVVLREIDESSGERWVIARAQDDQEIGVVEYEVGNPATGWLTIRQIEMAAGYRGWGYGSEAVRLLEEMAVERGLGERFRADVDVKNGLGLYFGLRLGYRPAAEESGSSDTLAMVRAS